MIPGARVTIEHRGRLDSLLAVRLATLAFEGIMCVRSSVWLELEELAEAVKREVSLNVFCRVDHARRQRLFMGLTLEYFLFNGARGDKAVYET